jgi:hypothetical protein
VASDIIELTIFEIDEKLRSINGRGTLPQQEVIDILLDIRQSLDRYYVVRRVRGAEPVR